MTSCADLDPFFDGELAKGAAASFREHLVDCRRCQVALRGRMQEETALGKSPERGAQRPPAGATPALSARPVVVGNPEHDRIAGRLGDQVEQPLGEDDDPAAHRAVARELGGRRGGGRGRMLIFFAPALAAAAVVALWLVGTHGGPATSPAHSGAARPSSPIEFSLAIERRSAGAAGEARDSAAQVGDVLRPTVRGADHRAIWVYLEDRELVTSCPDSPGCSSAGGSLTLGLRVSAPGRYSIIEISSVQPIPMPHGPLDVMLSSIADVGAHFEIKHVDVN